MTGDLWKENQKLWVEANNLRIRVIELEKENRNLKKLIKTTVNSQIVNKL
jgi:hypothetical protein